LLKNKVEAVFGDIAFVRPGRLDKIVRLYSSRKFTPAALPMGICRHTILLREQALLQ